MLHFVLVFTESTWLKNKLIYLIIYVPALFFSLIDLITDLIFAGPVLEAWGYALVIQDNGVLANVYGIWSGTISLLALFTCGYYYNQVVDKNKKRQTKFIALGFAIPIIISLIADSLIRASGIAFPVLGPISGSFTSIFAVYAMVKCELFGFRAEIAVENVFSNMPDAVVLVNLKGVIIKINRSLVDLTGYSEAELVGKNLFDFLKGACVKGIDAAPEFFKLLQKLREVLNYELVFVNKAGDYKTAMLSGSVVTDNNGNDLGYTVILHDISELKLMEQKLLRAERLASIGELAGLIGHDLRNPLSGIRGAAYYLKRKHRDHLDKEDTAMFDSIDKCINYSNKIINDLLDYSCELHLDKVHIRSDLLVSVCLDMVDKPENIMVIVETSESEELFVDSAKLQRGFAGIVKNAFDAMPEGGELRIKTTVEGNCVVFSFADTGLGMSQETLKKLGTPLFTTKAKGMGFGLAICKRIVEAHNGRLSAVSAVDEGTTVRVDLPITQP